MDFEDHLAGLDAAVADEIGAAALLRPAAGGDPAPCRAILDLPTGGERLDGHEIVRARPTLEIPVALVAVLRKGDVVEAVEDGGKLTLQGRRWRVEAAPTRPGDGRWWLAEVVDLGAAAEA